MPEISYITKQQCSVFCKIESAEEVEKVLRSWLLDESRLESSYDGNFRINIYSASAQLDLFVLKRQTGGDRASKTLLGAFNYFNKIDADSSKNKRHVLKRLSNCNASIGISGKPEFSIDHKHIEYIFSLALLFDGIIFNGSGAVNECGELLLGADGGCTIEV